MPLFRQFAKALPRATSLTSRSVSRFPTSSLQRTARLIERPQCIARAVLASRSFSTSLMKFQAQEGSVDSELSAKFQQELQMEKEATETDELPPHLKEYLDSSPFELHDTLGQEEVHLTRSFGNEKIRVSFTIADLGNMDQDPESYPEDQALYDEETNAAQEAQSGGAQSKGAINQGRTSAGNIKVAPEDRIAPSDREELEDETLGSESETGFPAQVNIIIEKKGVAGALQIETIARDGQILIDNVFHYPQAELAYGKTADHDWSKRNLYTGPPFGNLDEELQVLLEKYIEERGINTALALWVPDYIDFKEQREYLDWLSNVKSFIDA